MTILLKAYAGSASVKYTTDDHYLIHRGILPEKHANGNGQYILHSKVLITSSLYDGVHFSWGDEKINEYAMKAVTDKPGGASTWVQIGMNRHLAKLISLR